MTTTGVNVLRWGSLVFGVFYGFSHQSAITSRDKMTAAQHEYDRKQNLIDQAKAEYKKKTMPEDKKTASGGIITDPNDAKFDLEAYLQDVAAKSP